jgi:penicillin-binding protein 1C
MERLGWTPATVLPDVELHLPLDEGTYAPNNYDERFHGPVRLREALGSSLNVPAVWTTEQLGVGAVLQRLREVGFGSLVADEDHYGPAIALGDGEVSLLELANAYAMLARGGGWRPVQAVHRLVRAGVPMDAAPAEERRAMPAAVAELLADVLSDAGARAAAFGERSVLDLPFAVAAKTGTSKGSRDNWTVGFTREVTVGVWVGNFDGSAMRGTSGITGAAPLFRKVMTAAMRGRSARPLRLAARAGGDSHLVEVEVCPLSGARPTHACPHAVREWMPADARDTLPTCAVHERVLVDRRNGLRAGPDCPAAFVEERTFERLAGPFGAWAQAAGRATPPERFSPLCPGTTARDRVASRVRIGWPNDGASFVLDPQRPRAEQALFIRVEASPGVDRVALLVDGRPLAHVGAPFVVRWPLSVGEHVLTASAGSSESAPVVVRVE